MTKTAFTDEEYAEFKRLWNEGQTGSRLAEIFGISRNAALGRANRMQKAGELARRGPRGQNRSVDTRGIQMEPDVQQKLPQTEITELPPDFSDCATHISNLEKGQCRWVIGEPKAFMFCGAPQIDDCAYCWRHTLRSYRASSFRPQHYPRYR